MAWRHYRYKSYNIDVKSKRYTQKKIEGHNCRVDNTSGKIESWVTIPPWLIDIIHKITKSTNSCLRKFHLLGLFIRSAISAPPGNSVTPNTKLLNFLFAFIFVKLPSWITSTRTIDKWKQDSYNKQFICSSTWARIIGQQLGTITTTRISIQKHQLILKNYLKYHPIILKP